MHRRKKAPFRSVEILETERRPRGDVEPRPYDEHHSSADGSAVIVREGRQLKMIRVDTRDGRVVVGFPEILAEHGSLARMEGRDLAIHPDEKRALIRVPESVSSEGPESRIILRTGWFEELERLTRTK